MSSSSAKQHKGQLQTVEGSMVGEAITVSRFAYNEAYCVEYIGEAKFNTPENDYKWHITKFKYDEVYNVTHILTASNTATTKATQVSVNPAIPTAIVVDIVGGVFDIASIGDNILVNTLTNKFRAKISQVMSPTQVIVANPTVPVLSEVSTVITADDLLISLELEENKDFAKRRWDKREFYLYK